MTRKSKRELERELDRLTVTSQPNRELRQNIPIGLIEEWEECSGHNMEWIKTLK